MPEIYFVNRRDEKIQNANTFRFLSQKKSETEPGKKNVTIPKSFMSKHWNSSELLHTLGKLFSLQHTIPCSLKWWSSSNNTLLTPISQIRSNKKKLPFYAHWVLLRACLVGIGLCVCVWGRGKQVSSFASHNFFNVEKNAFNSFCSKFLSKIIFTKFEWGKKNFA